MFAFILFEVVSASTCTLGLNAASLLSIFDCLSVQAAVKYGRKQRTYSDPRSGLPRWKYTHEEIVYITDWESRVEVTSWAEALKIEPVSLPQSEIVAHEEIASLFRQNPSLYTTHTVVGMYLLNQLQL